MNFTIIFREFVNLEKKCDGIIKRLLLIFQTNVKLCAVTVQTVVVP